MMGDTGTELAVEMKKPSVTEALEMEKKQLQARLDEINEVLGVLAQYPDIQKVIDVVSKHTRFR